MSSAEFPNPSFTWHSDRREQWRWRRIGFLLVLTAGAGFYVGRQSIEVPAPAALSVAKQIDPKPEQSAAAAVPQRQAVVQSDASKVAPEVRDETKEKPMDSLKETAKKQSITVAEREPSSPPVMLINPKSADKGTAFAAPKPLVSTTSPKAVATANANTEAHEAADSGLPPAPGRRQSKLRPAARANINVPPVRQDSVVARRGDAYVPPRIPQAEYAEQRGRYDNAEDAPPRRAYEGYDYRHEYLRPFQDFRDLREYRRFGGYDDTYAAQRPLLRPMYGGRDD